MEDAWDRGYEDGLNNKKYNNPYEKGTGLWDDYHEGYQYGIKEDVAFNGNNAESSKGQDTGL